jgi:predicted  nucleic acid-binding Zn-ribbon protein
MVDLTKELESQVGTAASELRQMKDRVSELEARLKVSEMSDYEKLTHHISLLTGKAESMSRSDG